MVVIRRIDMQVINKDDYRVPVFSWCPNIEENAQKQTDNLAKLPFAFKHIALMPDCHMGYGMPIGGVLATKGVIIPNAVGLDIGCGMYAVKTNLTDIDTDTLKNIMGLIRKTIPVGFAHRNKVDKSLMPSMSNLDANVGYATATIVREEFEYARTQLGTLGGGNHFIEIQKGSDGFIWFMIHSGSRNLGKKVAEFYNRKAIELNEQWFSSVPKEWQLAFLPAETDSFYMYVEEMKYCVEFAHRNRMEMAKLITTAFVLECGHGVLHEDPPINIAHNYAALENHFGQNVMVHRKGATLARDGTIGIIPGSQGTKSYIVKGKGNPNSFMSCSHGAGRKMGRKEAEKSLSLEEEIRFLDEQGIVHSIRNTSDLDEAPGAYKSIDEVMANQSDLVEILVGLTPLAVIKG